MVQYNPLKLDQRVAPQHISSRISLENRPLPFLTLFAQVRKLQARHQSHDCCYLKKVLLPTQTESIVMFENVKLKTVARPQHDLHILANIHLSVTYGLFCRFRACWLCAGPSFVDCVIKTSSSHAGPERGFQEHSSLQDKVIRLALLQRNTNSILFYQQQ